MIRTIEIRNYKSIEHIQLELGRLNVFIGENGAGKSNILEAIALVGAAASQKLDNEFLSSRGVRVTQPQLMRPQFEEGGDMADVAISVQVDDSQSIDYIIQNDNRPYSKWNAILKKNGKYQEEFALQRVEDTVKAQRLELQRLQEEIAALHDKLYSLNVMPRKEKKKKTNSDQTFIKTLINHIYDEFVSVPDILKDFVIYSPEQSCLRALNPEGQIQPLGISGEGLLKLLSVLATDDDGVAFRDINERLKVLGWFESFEVTKDSSELPIGIDIKDRHTILGSKYFDQKSANEGFLFLLFYFALFSTKLTPDFFAVDNIDASLNPKLCRELMIQLNSLAKSHNKQAILTTHNPAILDGINLEDDEQRLFVVSRNQGGLTRIKRIIKPKNMDIKLSEMFMRGVLGGLPKDF